MSYIVIGPYQFDISMPAKAGDIMTEVQADTLNYHRAGLIAKIVDGWVKKAVKEYPGQFLPHPITEHLQRRVTELDSEYTLPSRKPPRQSFLNRELTAVARQALRSQGFHEPTEEQLRTWKAMPSIQDRARKLIEARIHELL